jgi:hypothetical protein
LEISPPRHRGGYNGPFPSPYYDNHGDHVSIFASLSNYLSIIDTGTVQVQIPYKVIERLRGGETYDVFMRIVDVANVDARQLLIGRLPVAYAGHHGAPPASSGGLT